MKSLVKVTAAVTVLAATAAFYVSTGSSYVFSAGFLSSPPFLWVAANVIIIWLLSSSRRSAAGPAAAATDVLTAVDELYPSSDYEGFSSSSSVVSMVEAPAVSSKPKRQPREARAARRTDRARVPKKPAGGDAAAVATSCRAVAVMETSRPHAAAAAPSQQQDSTENKDDDVSMDSLWQSMLQRRTVRPVTVRKSDTWGNDELPRLQRAAETAVARRREMRKSVSTAGTPPPPPEAPPPASAVRQLGWRTRDVLVKAHDDLLRRAESLIRRHHEQLRLQRQESEQRRAMDQQQQQQRARHQTLIHV